MNALGALAITPGEIADLVHGSTVATNAVLERKGARVAALMTKGTRDILDLQRHSRSSIYKLQYQKPRPLVPRHCIFELDGRIDASGAEVVALDEDEMEARLRAIFSSGDFDVIAVCLLNSYINPAHEQAVKAAAERLDARWPVVCSHEISREFREYERASTTVLSGFVQPVVRGYLQRLEDSLSSQGFVGHFSVMQSNGGRMPARAMGDQAITALLSGPAAGVIGALKAAERSGIADIITLDMGGTSADVSLVEGGRPALASQMTIDGLPVRMPVVDIATVGAGGGSIAWIDDGGMLRVGPQSAGADPGPASYGRGGDLPTVTDANLVRGSLRQSSFKRIGFQVDRQAALSVYEGLARTLGCAIEDAADAVIRVAEANVVRAIQQVYTARGKDPRQFALVAFGGAGALHAVRIAEELGLTRVIIPAHAGVLSAAGLLASDYLHFSVTTERLRLSEPAMVRVREVVATLTKESQTYLAAQGLEGEPQVEVALDMRYVGQAFEVSVPVHAALDTLSFANLSAAFAKSHHQIFEFSKGPDAAVEIVSYRVGLRLGSPNFAIDPSCAPLAPDSEDDWVIHERGQTYTCTVIQAETLGDIRTQGPMLIEEGTTTIFVPTGWSARRDPHANVILEPRKL
jgi:N-methylhydantoinase A